MRLTLKVTLAFLSMCVAVLAVNAQLRVSRERYHFEQQRDHAHRVLGALVAATIAEVWANRGVDAARDLLGRAQSADMAVKLRLVCVGSDASTLPAELSCQGLRALRGRDVRSVIERDDLRQAAHLTYIAVPIDDSRTEVLEIRESLDAEQRFVKTSIRRSVTTATLVVLLCGLASFVAGLLIVGVPSRKLIAKAERVGRGDLSGPLALRQHDEIGDLARAMDAMCDQLAAARDQAEGEARGRLRAFEQLRHAERLTTVGKMASGLAHEIGTPLNVIDARASTIADGTVQGERAMASAKAIVEAVDRITRIVRALLDFSRHKGEGTVPVTVRSFVEGATEFLRPMAERRRVALETDFGAEGVRVRGDALQLGQAVTNLVVNAIHASPDGEVVRVEVSVVDAAPPGEVGAAGSYVRVRVTDRGAGVPPEHRDRVFEPFFTTKDVGEGTGLGLSVAWGIAGEHDGWLTLDDHPGGGSVFMLYLPALMRDEAEA